MPKNITHPAPYAPSRIARAAAYVERLHDRAEATEDPKKRAMYHSAYRSALISLTAYVVGSSREAPHA